jgi:RHS repeat-associated protein
MWRFDVGTATNPIELYDARARMWSPRLGTFLSVDEFAFHDPKSTLWAWPNQNPSRYADPSGRCGPLCIAIAIAGVAIGYGTLFESDDAQRQREANPALTANPALGIAVSAGMVAGMGALPRALGAAPSTALASGAGPACSAGVKGSLASAIEQGLVTLGGKLAGVLGGIEQGFGANAPRSAVEALGIVEQATAQVGLEAGYATSGPTGEIILQNAGGITTTLGTDGSIIVQRGSDVLLHLVH